MWTWELACPRRRTGQEGTRLLWGRQEGLLWGHRPCHRCAHLCAASPQDRRCWTPWRRAVLGHSAVKSLPPHR